MNFTTSSGSVSFHANSPGDPGARVGFRPCLAADDFISHGPVNEKLLTSSRVQESKEP